MDPKGQNSPRQIHEPCLKSSTNGIGVARCFAGGFMDIIIFLTVGLFVGWLASLLVEGHGFGVFGNIFVGIVGAFVGDFIYDVIGMAAYGFWANIFMSIVGAVVFLFILSLILGRRHFTDVM